MTNECLAILNLDYEKCPGRYCGRILLSDLNCTFSQCQVNRLPIFSIFYILRIFSVWHLKKCPRGYRASEFDVCQPCQNELSLYDYMFLGFILTFAIILNFEFIDRSLWLINKKKYDMNWFKYLFNNLFPKSTLGSI